MAFETPDSFCKPSENQLKNVQCVRPDLKTACSARPTSICWFGPTRAVGFVLHVNVGAPSTPLDSAPAVAPKGQGDRRAQNVADLTQILRDRRQSSGEAMSRDNIVDQDSARRIIGLKHGLLANMQEIARANPKSDILPALLVYISVHSDSRYGCCTYGVDRIARFFGRGWESIRDALDRGVKQKLWIREVLPNRMVGYYPWIDRRLVDPEISPHHIVEALAPSRRRGRPPKENTSAPAEVILETEITSAPTRNYVGSNPPISTSMRTSNVDHQRGDSGNSGTADDDGADATRVIPFPKGGRHE
jgi:hypothetical protein